MTPDHRVAEKAQSEIDIKLPHIHLTSSNRQHLTVSGYSRPVTRPPPNRSIGYNVQG